MGLADQAGRPTDRRRMAKAGATGRKVETTVRPRREGPIPEEARASIEKRVERVLCGRVGQG